MKGSRRHHLLLRVVVSIILASTGAAKLWTALVTSPPFVHSLDPLLEISNGMVMLAGGAIEVMLCLTLPFLGNRAAGILVTGFSIPLIMYHVIVLIGGLEYGCPCLGGVESMLGITRTQSTMVAQVLVAFLFLSGILMARWNGEKFIELTGMQEEELQQTSVIES